MASQGTTEEAGLSRLSWLVMLLATGVIAALWGGWLFYFSSLAWQAEWHWKDFLTTRLSPTPQRTDLKCLGVDEASLSLSSLEEETIAASEVLPMMRERYPWNRRVWAAVVDRLGEAGAKVIVLDFIFTEPSDDPEADRLLAEAIARHRDKVVLASLWGRVRAPDGQDMFVMREPLEEFLGPIDNETAIGYVNFWTDAEDGLIRNANYRITAREANGKDPVIGEPRYDSIAGAAARKLGANTPRGNWRLRFAATRQSGDGPGAGGERQGDYLAINAYAPRSLYEIFVPDLWEERFGSGSEFAGRVVLVGPTAARFQDKHPTPSGLLFGPQLILQALGCLLGGSFWTFPPRWAEWALLGGLALAGMVFVRLLRNPFALLGAVVLVGAVLALGCGYLANHTGVLLTGFSGLLGLVAVTVTGGTVEFLIERARRKRLHRQLQRSVSPDVADQMVRAPSGYFEMARGRRRKVVVLFSDVRGFTAWSEQSQPERLVEQLNEYFSRMVRIVFARNGILDKFIGDAVMATWGGLSDEPYETLAHSAVTAAAEMQVALEALNAEWEQRGLAPFKIGIGIHFGEAVVGEIGSEERSDFTAIGDAVNVASRVEGLTKHLGVPVLLTGEAAAKLGGDLSVLSLGRFGVAGRRGVLELFTLANGTFPEDARNLGLALERIQRGEWDPAAESLAGMRDDGHLAGLKSLYRDELEKARAGDDGDWNGVVRLATK